ncbi:hypothetical protein E2C01_089335 [Portunus trituberculatus]|uniref:Uncharacterized protein n=1 Tax=Portunus trituberculatus TaxID=210409 RepID=A0A5B7JGX7_PORTR|nr:hypothetical protein [Portunus trituberculatus]
MGTSRTTTDVAANQLRAAARRRLSSRRACLLSTEPRLRNPSDSPQPLWPPCTPAPLSHQLSLASHRGERAVRDLTGSGRLRPRRLMLQPPPGDSGDARAAVTSLTPTCCFPRQDQTCFLNPIIGSGARIMNSSLP